MQEIVGVRFKEAGKIYYFDPVNINLNINDFVIVETSRGLEYGEIVIGPKKVSRKEIVSPLKKVIRRANKDDHRSENENKEKEIKAFSICTDKIKTHRLPMKLVDVEYTFDNSKVIFYFTADGRVDFRDLVKELASIFRTRIELRQIGVRDEAKMLGGIGPCGRILCCKNFLGDFEPVSIKMAKEQNLSLNPSKISGICSRLMCCLKYEQEYYEATRKIMPRINKEINTPKGPGIVISCNMIKEMVRVKLIQEDGTPAAFNFTLDELQNHAKEKGYSSYKDGPNNLTKEELAVLLD